jgi:hypothetical protein
VKKEKWMKIHRAWKRKSIIIKKSKRDQLLQKKINIPKIMTLNNILINIKKVKNIHQMILILRRESKITDCLIQDILQKPFSEEHQLIQEDLKLHLEVTFHLKGWEPHHKDILSRSWFITEIDQITSCKAIKTMICLKDLVSIKEIENSKLIRLEMSQLKMIKNNLLPKVHKINSEDKVSLIKETSISLWEEE